MAIVPAVDTICLPPQAPPARPRRLLIATTFVLVGISMAFAGLIGIYLDARNTAIKEGLTFLPDSVNIELTPANVALFGLLVPLLSLLLHAVTRLRVEIHALVPPLALWHVAAAPSQRPLIDQQPHTV